MPMTSQDHVRDVKRLSETYHGGRVMAAVNPSEHSQLILAANRAGAAQVAVLPIVGEDFRQALAAINKLFSHNHDVGQAVAVVGVTGGCGATTVALNLAYEISTYRAMETILVELSTQLGIHATYLNLDPKFTTYDLLKDIHRVDGHMLMQAATKVVGNFSALVAPYRSINKFPVHHDHFIHLVHCERGLPVDRGRFSLHLRRHLFRDDPRSRQRRFNR